MKIILLAFFCVLQITLSQIHEATIKPQSFIQKQSFPSAHTIILPKVNIERALQEEQKEKNENLAPRYGIPQKISYSMKNSGTYTTLSDGSRVWRISFQSTGAFFTHAAFDRFYLAPEATLHVLTQDKTTFMGAYTAKNNKKDSTFSIAPIKGEKFTLELHEPKRVVGKSVLRIFQIVHAYKDIFGDSKSSGACNVNVACPAGDEWRNQIQSVAALVGFSGRFCTGSLINNNKEDGRRLFLTAAHCGTLGSRWWNALFNYQTPGCGAGRGRTTDTVSGMNSLFQFPESDVSLFELREPLPAAYNLFLNGFSARTDPEQGTSCGIHHPSGDVKKISFSRVPLIEGMWRGGPENTHWRVQRWSEGTTEGGSSGSPLYDSNKRVIGQLHGGTASCNNMAGWDVYGKISLSWERGLNRWLDPDNTGKRENDGILFNNIRK